MPGQNHIIEISLTLDANLEEALDYFKRLPYINLPVTDQNGKYAGIINLKDIVFSSLLHKADSVAAFVKPFPAVQKQQALFRWPDGIDILPIADDDNKLLGFITEAGFLNHLSRKYETLAHEYYEVINASYNGIIVIDKEGRIVVFNAAAERILGKKCCDIFGQHISFLDPAMGLLETMEKNEPAIGVRTEINGSVILTNRTPIVDANGDITGAMGVFIDISDLERISAELKLNQALAAELNAIIEASYDGLYVADRHGKVIRVNSAWEKICGFSREEILGKTAAELVAAGFYDNSAALLTLEKRETSTVMLEITAGPKKGQKIIATGTPFFGSDGELNLVVVNVRDITALEHLKKQLEETKALSKRYASELNEIRLQQMKIDDIVAKSAAMRRVIELAIRVSQVDSTVIVTGESGVGKEVVVKKIHQMSNRRDKSLIKINCGAIPENLLETELFGYEGGAFTGAKKEGKPGMFELASGGTLFLDEIGDLPLNLQVKLLRVLQEHEIVRVGGVRPIKVNARIIAATNKDLAQMVAKGSFREDLFYRLNVVNIVIPPLRSRKEDLPPLINMILQKINDKYKLNKRLAPSVAERLYNYHWPGNIRELENVLERVAVLVNDDLIQVDHLPDFLQTSEKKTAPVILNRIIPLKHAIEETELQLIKKALREYGTTRKVAKILEVNQSTIVRKMQQYRIDKDDVEQHQEDAYAHLLRI
ncbi:MAG: sigma 54-interacting transcriptional regulator [Negativicutes bacterium]|nr:sigma 54-interacting transcriptional regulator [Negativicutes bacterium]